MLRCCLVMLEEETPSGSPEPGRGAAQPLGEAGAERSSFPASCDESAPRCNAELGSARRGGERHPGSIDVY